MKPPRRWAESPDAPVGMRELLRAAAPTRAMDEAAFKRGAKRLGRASLAPAAAAAAVSIWAKLAAAGAIGLAAAGTVVAIESSHPPDPPSRRAAPAAPTASMVVQAPAIAPSVETSEPAPERVPAPRPPVVAAAKPAPIASVAAAADSAPVWVPEPPSRTPSTLADEVVLVDTARAAVATRPDYSLQKVAEHRARYPNGLLAEERDLVELDALRRAGRVEDARIRARAWLARDPSGIHAARVRAILAAIE